MNSHGLMLSKMGKNVQYLHASRNFENFLSSATARLIQSALTFLSDDVLQDNFNGVNGLKDLGPAVN